MVGKKCTIITIIMVVVIQLTACGMMESLSPESIEIQSDNPSHPEENENRSNYIVNKDKQPINDGLSVSDNAYEQMQLENKIREIENLINK